jgi:hypothetical protein
MRRLASDQAKRLQELHNQGVTKCHETVLPLYIADVTAAYHQHTTAVLQGT